MGLSIKAKNTSPYKHKFKEKGGILKHHYTGGLNTSFKTKISGTEKLLTDNHYTFWRHGKKLPLRQDLLSPKAA